MEMINTKSTMPLNLQFFADEGQGAAQEPAPNAQESAMPTEETAPTTDPAKAADDKPKAPAKPASLTGLLAEDKALQSQFDKLTAKALETARSKWEKEKDMTAEELAKTKAQEKAQELAEREQAVTARELRAKAIGTLAEKALPTELVDAIACTDEESMTAHLDKVEKAFRAAVDKAVKSQMAGSPPPAGNQGGAVDPFRQKVDKYRRT